MLAPQAPTPPTDRGAARRLQRTAFACAALVFGMVGLAFASVPLYDLFCRMTGFGGTPIVGSRPAEGVGERTLSVRFDANVAPGLEWRFVAEAPEIEARVGETKTVFYRLRNAGRTAATGVATFNVQPALSGAYFIKLECFCFKEHTLQPGESMDVPVVFYLDPALEQDPNLASLKSVTLSYTYFPARNGAPAVTAAAPATPAAR
jgi:cytochrome c oxidase assembly protein subunit 11